MSELIKMYHGGKKWYRIPEGPKASYKGRYEYGPGIYTTNYYNTAYQYAKGGRSLHLLYIDPTFKDINDVDINIVTLIEFLKNNPIKNKKVIAEHLVDYSNRANTKNIPLYILNNLLVNFDAGAGKMGMEAIKFFIECGADAQYIRKSGDEFWMIIYNPKIIKKMEIVKPNNMGKYPYDFEIKNNI